MSEEILIVGASVAGIRTAQALRAIGEVRPIRILERDEQLPYDRPPLSKGFLSGKAEGSPLLSLEAARDLSITIDLGVQASGLDQMHVVTTSGDRYEFADLVVATGADARRGPWHLPACAHVLRTQSDAAGLRSALAGASSLAIIGGGFIGSEVAATVASTGIAVTLIDNQPIPLARVAGPEVGRHLLENLSSLGVEQKLGVAVGTIVGTSSGGAVIFEGGDEVAADVILIGIGASEQTEWLHRSGLEIDDGIVCNHYGQAVGHDRIWAVGDAARWLDPNANTGHRTEHWTAAVDQANVVAHNIANRGSLTGLNTVPYVWSDQGSWKIQLAGDTGAGVTPHTFGTPGHGAAYAAVYSADGAIRGAITINWPRAMIQARRAIAQGTSALELCQWLESKLPHT